jgi:hypothetical protein
MTQDALIELLARLWLQDVMVEMKAENKTEKAG